MLRYLSIMSLLLLSGIGLQAQPALTPITIGETITVNVAAIGAAAPGNSDQVSIGFELTEPEYVSFAARSLDGVTDPALTLMESGRTLAYVPDNPFSPLAQSAKDAALDDQLLLPGIYQLMISRTDTEGNGEVEVTLQPAEGDGLGIGQVDTITGTILPAQEYVQQATFLANTLITVYGIALQPDLVDLQIVMRDADGNIIAQNDDHGGIDSNLTQFDSRFELFIPNTGDYTFTITTLGQNAGDFRLVVRQIGLENDGVTKRTQYEVYVPLNGRAKVNFEGRAGEVINVTAEGFDRVDTVLALLSPDDIYLGENDDHAGTTEGLSIYDSQIERVTLREDGSYLIEVRSLGNGEGPVTITVETIGILGQYTDLPRLDPEAFEVYQPDLQPEITAEPEQ